MGVAVILIRPVVAGNVGAVGRLMGNFDVDELVVVSPECDHLSKEALDRAKHNKHVLQNAKVVQSMDDLDFDVLVATTSQTGSDFNLPRSPLTPKQLGEKVTVKGSIGVVFGPEGPGLTNEEIKKCDFSVAIPTSKDYASMNLSHAVGIILYELFVARALYNITTDVTPVPAADKRQLIKMFDEAIESIDWGTKDRAETQRTLWRKIIGKSFVTKREAMAMMGFLSQMAKKQQSDDDGLVQ